MAVSRAKLHVPPLEELSKVLENGLKKHFQEASVTVTDCPDLEQEPFHLAAKGLSGHTRLVDIGGVSYLVPLAQTDKVYDFKDIAKKIDLPDAFIIGAAVGPHKVVGVNSEWIPNLKLGDNEVNKTHCVKIVDGEKMEMAKFDSCTGMSLHANVFASDGKPGPVLKVVAKKRNANSKSFVALLREIIKEHYGEKSVGLGGVFLVEKGKAMVYVMPGFSKVPLNSDKDLENWLKFFEVSAPMICLSTFISQDPGLDLRAEHTHCFSTHGEGGHYHSDVITDDVEFQGYFNVAEYIFRVDPPAETRSYGQGWQKFGFFPK